jgi:hypothetical protein
MGELTELQSNMKELSIEIDYLEILLIRSTEQNRSKKASN